MCVFEAQVPTVGCTTVTGPAEVDGLAVRSIPQQFCDCSSHFAPNRFTEAADDVKAMQLVVGGP